MSFVKYYDAIFNELVSKTLPALGGKDCVNVTENDVTLSGSRFGLIESTVAACLTVADLLFEGHVLLPK